MHSALTCWAWSLELCGFVALWLWAVFPYFSVVPCEREFYFNAEYAETQSVAEAVLDFSARLCVSATNRESVLLANSL